MKQPFNQRQQRRLRVLTTAALSHALFLEHRRKHPPDPTPATPPASGPRPEDPPPQLPGFGVDLKKHLPPHSRH